MRPIKCRNARSQKSIVSDPLATATEDVYVFHPKAEGKLYVKVDETGNPGPRTEGQSHYVIAGCLVEDELAFANVVRNIDIDHELKFHDDPEYRDTILGAASPFVQKVFYIQFSKKHNKWLGDNSREIKSLHRGLLDSFAEAISKEVRIRDLDVIVDESTLISKNEVVQIFQSRFKGTTTNLFADVHPSCDDYCLQTNDFFVGSIGYWFNTPNTMERRSWGSHALDSERLPNSRPVNYYIWYFQEKLMELYR